MSNDTLWSLLRRAQRHKNWSAVEFILEDMSPEIIPFSMKVYRRDRFTIKGVQVIRLGEKLNISVKELEDCWKACNNDRKGGLYELVENYLGETSNEMHVCTEVVE